MSNIIVKICNKCKIEKTINNFHFRKDNNKYRNSCKCCLKKQQKQRYQKKREEILDYHKNYYKTNKKKINKRNKDKRTKDLDYRLGCNLRSRLNKALRLNVKKGSSVKDLECSIEELRVYLESNFQPGMSWENYGLRGWHIDHIKPLSSFDLTNREQFLEACHYTNLQPLWAKENISKGGVKNV